MRVIARLAASRPRLRRTGMVWRCGAIPFPWEADSTVLRCFVLVCRRRSGVPDHSSPACHGTNRAAALVFSVMKGIPSNQALIPSQREPHKPHRREDVLEGAAVRRLIVRRRRDEGVRGRTPWKRETQRVRAQLRAAERIVRSGSARAFAGDLTRAPDTWRKFNLESLTLLPGEITQLIG